MHDVAVIGAGPCGIAASIFLKRAGFDIILFERKKIGGLLLNANLVENYPGFPYGINGLKLCKLMEEHLKKWNIKPLIKEVKKIIVENDYFYVNIKQDKIKCKAMIIATGTKPKELDISIDKGLIGKKVFYEINDLLPIIRTKDICTVIGGGDAAFDYSLNLAEKGIITDIFFRTEKPNCLSILEERVKKSLKIKIHSSVKPYKIKKNNKKIEVSFKCSKDNSIIKKLTDYVLIACGRVPNLDLISKIKKGDISGLFIAGELNNAEYRQVGIAVGHGLYAAMSAEKYLRGRK